MKSYLSLYVLICKLLSEDTFVLTFTEVLFAYMYEVSYAYLNLHYIASFCMTLQYVRSKMLAEVINSNHA